MKILKIVYVLILIMVSLPIGIVVIYHSQFPTYVVRYRLTVLVSTGGNVHEGSSVVETRISMQPPMLGAPPWSFRLVGESVFVDLGDGRNLIAALSPGYTKGVSAIDLLFKAFDLPINPKSAPELARAAGERHISPRNWPAFVTFHDLADPLSLEIVDPSAPGVAVGTDVQIRDVVLKITDEPLSIGLAQKLAWLAAPLSLQQMNAMAKLGIRKVDLIGEQSK